VADAALKTPPGDVPLDPCAFHPRRRRQAAVPRIRRFSSRSIRKPGKGVEEVTLVAHRDQRRLSPEYPKILFAPVHRGKGSTPSRHP